MAYFMTSMQLRRDFIYRTEVPTGGRGRVETRYLCLFTRFAHRYW